MDNVTMEKAKTCEAAQLQAAKAAAFDEVLKIYADNSLVTIRAFKVLDIIESFTATCAK